MRRIYYHKLIRDKIPESIKEWGGEYEVKKLGAKRFEEELLKKVGEEASGLLKATTKEEMTAELADVIDVLEEIKKLKRISERQVDEARKRAIKKKGGFKKKLFLVWSSDTGYKTNERRYTKKTR